MKAVSTRDRKYGRDFLRRVSCRGLERELVERGRYEKFSEMASWGKLGKMQEMCGCSGWYGTTIQNVLQRTDEGNSCSFAVKKIIIHGYSRCMAV